MKLLSEIPKEIKIGAIWGKQDPITSSKMELSQAISSMANEEPERFSYKLIEGGHILHDDSPEEVLDNMKVTFQSWFSDGH